MIITRRAFTAALSVAGFAALAGISPLRLIAEAIAQGAADVAKPVSLPDMVPVSYTHLTLPTKRIV